MAVDLSPFARPLLMFIYLAVTLLAATDAHAQAPTSPPRAPPPTPAPMIPPDGAASELTGGGPTPIRPITQDIHSPGHLPPVPLRPERGPTEIEKFVQDLSQRDTSIQVILGQGRLLTLREDLVVPDGADPYIAMGDPTVADFDVVGPRHLRITGQRIGITDLSIVGGDQQEFNVEVQVIADVDLLRARLMQAFPDASIQITPMMEHLIVSGEGRDAQQIAQIMATIEAYLKSMQVSKRTQGQQGGQGALPTDLDPAYANDPSVVPVDPETGEPVLPVPQVVGASGGPRSAQVELPGPEIINLMRVPGPRQVMLRVQVAELNRTAFRQLGVSLLLQNGGNAIGSQISSPFFAGQGGGSGVSGAATLLQFLEPSGVPLFGIFDSGRANFFLQALRGNQVLKVLAEPNLVALDGQVANFLAGGEFPVPVPQPGSGGNTVTIEYREFGVSLDFIPHVLDDDMIRLSVAPEVSSLDFATGITVAGVSVPGLNTRRTSTVVELREGQTLAISGILQIEMAGDTQRIPGLGDLPLIGSFFRNTTNRAVEKELVVLVTPFLVQPMPAGANPCLPGDDVLAPDDFELFLLGRIERRRPSLYRPAVGWDDPLGYEKGRWRGNYVEQTGGTVSYRPGHTPIMPPTQWQVEQHYVEGPVGFSP